jgi:hypothetical protein
MKFIIYEYTLLIIMFIINLIYEYTLFIIMFIINLMLSYLKAVASLSIELFINCLVLNFSRNAIDIFKLLSQLYSQIILNRELST